MELSILLDVITAAAVIVGILFGLLQLRHYHLSRTREADLFLLNSYQTAEFAQGVWLVQELPDGLSKGEIEERLGQSAGFLYLVMGTWDSVGILVFNRELSIDIVKVAFGDSILFSWKKLERYVREVRKDLERETRFEWFQWLAEKLIDRKQGSRLPAYLAFQEWK